MSNASIIQQIHAACDRYEAGVVAPAVLGKQISGLAEALEGVRPPVIEAARAFDLRLVGAQDDLDYGDDDQARAVGQAVVADVRAWLASLTGQTEPQSG